MGFFNDLLENETVQDVLAEGGEAVFEYLLEKLEELAANTETDADNIALEALLRAAADRLAAEREDEPQS